jgi:tetratricopeptide (TPR) repeat protein
MGRLAESEALLLDALANQPPRDMKNWLRDGLARTYREKGDYRAAKDTWDRLIRENPTDVNFILNSISAEAPLGHYEIASDRNDRAVSLGVSEYGRSVGLSNLAFAAYYGGEDADAKRDLDVLLHQAEPLFSEEIAALALILDYRVEAARDRIETLHRGALSLPLQVAKAGLQAKLGDTSELDDLVGQRPSDEPSIRLGLVRALLALQDPAAVDVAQSLVESVPDNPLYRYLLGRALRDANQPGWEQHAEAAVGACPDNVVFQQASTPSLPTP